MLSPEELRKQLEAIARQREMIELQMAVAWSTHVLATHNNNGPAETAAREDLHRLLDLQLDNIGAITALKKKAGYLC